MPVWPASALGCSGDDSGSATQAPPSATLLTAPLGDLPSKLSEVGLYRGAGLDARAPALAYEPGYPLWSDGGDKRRAIVLPEGASIDGSDPENYLMPLGTLIFKTFAFRTRQSPDARSPAPRHPRPRANPFASLRAVFHRAAFANWEPKVRSIHAEFSLPRETLLSWQSPVLDLAHAAMETSRYNRHGLRNRIDKCSAAISMISRPF